MISLTSKGLLRTAVYERLLQDLEESAISPGDFITLAALSEALKISRTPLRDALLELQVEGFVTLYPQRGVMINQLSEADKHYLYEISGLLEACSVLNVFPKISERHIRRMKEINDQMQPDLPDLSSITYNRHNTAFHNVYLELEPNPFMKKLLLTNRMLLFQFAARDWGEEFCWTNYNEHKKIIELFETGTAEQVSVYVGRVHWSFNW